jgi:hypothetical protein
MDSRRAVNADPARLHGLGDFPNQLDLEEAVVVGGALPLHVIGTTVSIQRDRDAAHRLRDEDVELVGGVGAAAILQAVRSSTELGTLWRIDSQSRMRWPWISIASPSMMLTCPARLSAAAAAPDVISMSAIMILQQRPRDQRLWIAVQPKRVLNGSRQGPVRASRARYVAGCLE